MAMHLVIKAPNQAIPDHNVEAQSDWTILRLKEFLSQSYPSHPDVEDQKLIYAGRLVHNHLLLKDILRQEGPLHVLHLVCRSPISNQTSSSSVLPSVSDVGPIHTPASPVVETRNVPSSQPPASSLHYRGPRQHPDSSTSTYQFQVPVSTPGIPPSPEVLAQQMAAMQQFYAYYVAQFMQHAQAAGVGPFPDLSTVGRSGAPADPSSIVAQGPEDVPEAAAAPQEPPRANQRMNAQGGPLFEDEDEEANRDWLDWFYVFSRAFVLFSIVYFYSSLGRFMMVVGITVLIYMYQGGWLGVGRRREQQVQAEEREQQQQQQAPEDRRHEQPEEEELRAPPEEGLDSASQDTTPTQQQEQGPPTNHPSALVTVWIFVKSFFASLIPEQPPPVNVN